jgi:hypothetical protein
VCGAVNAKNQMGGYIGMTGLTYEPEVDRAILLWSCRNRVNGMQKSGERYSRARTASAKGRFA